MRYFLGVDVGGTTSTVGIASEEREVLYVSDQFATTPDAGPDAVVSAIVDNSMRILSSAGTSPAEVEAVGLATPGPATKDGVLLATTNLPQAWSQFPIRERLEDAFRRHNGAIVVSYVGDGQAAALGEYAICTRRLRWSQVDAAALPTGRLSSLFMVTVGTGLGGGAVRDGRAVRGSEGRAGHVGHISLPVFAFRYEHDRTLRVGNALGTAEAAISLTALAHQLEYRLTLDRWSDHPLHQSSGPARERAKSLRDLAAGGDALAMEMFEDQAKALGITLLNANYLGDYDRMVVGGGVCDLAPKVRKWYLDVARKKYQEQALDGFRGPVDIEYSLCGDEAPVIGAIAWVLIGQESIESSQTETGKQNLRSDC